MNKTQATMTDPELYALCKKWGAEALEARRKFIGLLPEVNARRLYERRGYSSIYHFAAVLGGVGRGLVDDVLRLEKRFEEMPRLHTALINGEIGLSKLARIASVAEVRNEGEICEKIRTLSRRAVDVLVKEMGEKIKSEQHLVNSEILKGEEAVENRDGLIERKNEAKSLAGQNYDFEILSVLSPEVKAKLKELIDKEIDINEIILGAMVARETEIARQKMEIVEAQIKQAQNAKCLVKNDVKVGEGVCMVGGLSGSSESVNLPVQSRNIPVKIRRVLKLEFGSKCADSGCQKRSEHIHHERLFANYAEHDPRMMKPLCRGHHELEHAT